MSCHVFSADSIALVGFDGWKKPERASLSAFAQKIRRRLSNLFLWDGPMELPTPEMENGNHSRMSMIRDRGVLCVLPTPPLFHTTIESPSPPIGLFTECLLSRLIFQSGLVGELGFGVSSSLTSLPFWRGTHEKTLRSLPRHSVGRSCGHCVFSLKNS